MAPTPIPPVPGSTRPILIALLTALYFVPVHAAEQMEASKDMVVLTISGDIHNINRGALSTLLCLRPSYVALPQAGEGPGATPELKQPATFTGPLLKEVLAGVGAQRGQGKFSRRGRLSGVARS
jgi:hypothetical protein